MSAVVNLRVRAMKIASHFESIALTVLLRDFLQKVEDDQVTLAARNSRISDLERQLAKAQSDAATCCMVAGQVAKEAVL